MSAVAAIRCAGRPPGQAAKVPSTIRWPTDRRVAAGLAHHLGLQRCRPAELRAAGCAERVQVGALPGVVDLRLDQAEREKDVPAGIAAATRSGKRRRRRGPRKGDLGQLAALVVLGVGLILLVQQTPLGVSEAVLVPLLLGGLGVALIWRTADQQERVPAADTSPRTPWLAALLGKGGVMAVFRIVAGVAVIVAGVVAFLVGQGELQAILDSLLGVTAVIGGLALILGPWLAPVARPGNRAQGADRLTGAGRRRRICTTRYCKPSR